jgi:membrane protein YdbS with pleckstrin-like domain
MGPLSNREMTGVWVGIIIALLGLVLVLVLAPGLSGMDMMRSGFGIMFIGFFVIIVGIITAAVFGQRAREMNRILADENIVARWTYSEAESRQQVQEQFARQSAYNRSTFIIMFAWFVVIGGAFMGYSLFSTGEVNWFFAVLFFGILLFLALVAFITPVLWRQQAERSSREVIIARSGLVLNGGLHTWVRPLNRLESVQFNETPGEKALEFEIGAMSRAGMAAYTPYTVIVPLPAGQEADAQRIVDYFNGNG